MDVRIDTDRVDAESMSVLCNPDCALPDGFGIRTMIAGKNNEQSFRSIKLVTGILLAVRIVQFKLRHRRAEGYVDGLNRHNEKLPRRILER